MRPRPPGRRRRWAWCSGVRMRCPGLLDVPDARPPGPARPRPALTINQLDAGSTCATARHGGARGAAARVARAPCCGSRCASWQTRPLPLRRRESHPRAGPAAASSVQQRPGTRRLSTPRGPRVAHVQALLNNLNRDRQSALVRQRASLRPHRGQRWDSSLRRARCQCHRSDRP